jgi:DNA-binding NarL/FixJ family response regulator
MAARIYIVEDHDRMRRMVVSFLSGKAGFECVGEAATAEEALEELAQFEDETAVDLVLIDMSLPKMNGAELVSEIQQRWPALPCVVLSGHGEDAYVNRALEAGAQGYILKGDPYELKGAIEQVLRGERYKSPALGGSAA